MGSLLPTALTSAAIAFVDLASGAQAAPHQCPLDSLIGRGDPREVVIDFFTEPERTLPGGNIEVSIPMYARHQGAPDDLRLSHWWNQTYRITHYWRLTRLGQAYIDCYEHDPAYTAEVETDQAGVTRSAFRNVRQGFLLEIETSKAVCPNDSDLLRNKRSDRCLRIRATPRRP